MKFKNFFLVFFIFVTSLRAKADSFNLGLGGVYSYAILPNDSGSNSIYSGYGYSFDARFRFFPPLGTIKYSFDIFFEAGQNFTKNTSAADTLMQSKFAAGLDLYYYRYFIGMQYGRDKSTIKTASSYVNFDYDNLGIRTGAKIYGKANWGITLVGLYQTGIAAPSYGNDLRSSQKVNQFEVKLMFHFKTIGDRFSY